MRKIYSLVLIAAALLVGTNAWATNVSTLEELKSALTAGGNITLTADIDAGTTQLSVSNATTINGQGFCVKGTNTYVFQVNTTGEVVMEDLVIWAAKTSKAGRGILIGNDTDNANLTLNNVTINATYRAMDVWYSDGVNVAINNCTFQNVQGQAVDSKGNPTAANYDIELTGNNAGDTRGLNFGQLTNSTITINNSTMQGFFYVLNNITGDNGNMTGTTLTATNSTFKGRAALNVWGFGGNYTFNDCSVTGINNYGSDQEGFSCFVFNKQNTCHDNSLTINGGTVVSAVFDAVGASNPNANQYLIDTRSLASNINIEINNSQYTCTKGLGDDKGGIIYTLSSSSSLVVNGGVYNCPNIIHGAYSNTDGTKGSLIINGGQYNLSVFSIDMTDPDLFSAVSVKGGTFNLNVDSSDPNDAANKLIASDYMQVQNANNTYSIVPATTPTQEAPITPDEVNDISWNTQTDWGKTPETQVVPTEETNVVIGNGTDAVNVIVEENQSGEAYRLDLADQVNVTVQNNAVLTIGEGGIVFGDNNSTITVEPGGTLIAQGVMYNASDENIVLKASDEAQAIFLIDKNVTSYGAMHPVATFEIISNSYRTASPYVAVWQRFGIPSHTQITDMKCENAAITTYIYDFDNNANDWRLLGNFTGGTAGNDLIAKMNNPMGCYNMICDASASGTKYTITGELMGNEDATMNLNTNWSAFANSYSGKVDIENLVNAILTADNGAQPTVYVMHKTGPTTYTWETVNLMNAGDDALHTNLQPMQAFIIQTNNTSATIDIDYERMIWNPALNISSAPARRLSSSTMSNKAKIVLTNNENGLSDNLTIAESNNFSSDFDKAYDALKYMNNDVNIYLTTAQDQYALYATNDLEGQYIGLSCVNGGTYTISFEQLRGTSYMLRDIVANVLIPMTETSTYTFTIADNAKMDYRFQIVERQEMPTNVETIEQTTVATEGIYTLTGQFIGDVTMWNALPKGVYVVNGEKKVK